MESKVGEDADVSRGDHTWLIWEIWGTKGKKKVTWIFFLFFRTLACMHAAPSSLLPHNNYIFRMAANITRTYTLSNGVHMPVLGRRLTQSQQMVLGSFVHF